MATSPTQVRTGHPNQGRFGQICMGFTCKNPFTASPTLAWTQRPKPSTPCPCPACSIMHTFGAAPAKPTGRNGKITSASRLALMVKHTPHGYPTHTHGDSRPFWAWPDMLPPIDQMHLARLRYLKRLIQFCPQPLWTCLTATLGTKHSWLDACLQSCNWFRQFYPHHFGPENAQSTMDWIPSVAMDTKWKGRLKAAAQACRRHRRAVAEHHVWQKRFDSLFTSCGGILPVAQTVQAETWACDACDRTFASRRALATHAGRAHGYRRVVKYFAIGDVCNACCQVVPLSQALYRAPHLCAWLPWGTSSLLSGFARWQSHRAWPRGSCSYP